MSDATVLIDANVVAAIMGALLGGIFSLILTNRNARIDLDEATRKARVEEYKKLWALTEKLPLYPPKRLDYADLKKLCECFRHWYFHDGGIYLSEKSRDVYFSAQQTLMDYYQTNSGSLNPFDAHGNYDKTSDYEKIRQKLSELRTQLSQDIGSRRMPGSSIGFIEKWFIEPFNKYWKRIMA